MLVSGPCLPFSIHLVIVVSNTLDTTRWLPWSFSLRSCAPTGPHLSPKCIQLVLCCHLHVLSSSDSPGYTAVGRRIFLGSVAWINVTFPEYCSYGPDPIGDVVYVCQIDVPEHTAMWLKYVNSVPKLMPVRFCAYEAALLRMYIPPAFCCTCVCACKHIICKTPPKAPI